jgi:hypothetical protein
VAPLNLPEGETLIHAGKSEDALINTEASVERVGQMTYTPKALLGADFKKKLSEYNQAHPERPVSRPAYYFPGTPPLGIEHIAYDGGYFVTQDMVIEALG